MELQCVHEDGYVLVTCEGQLDDSTHRPFRDTIHPLFAERGAKVIVNLAAAKWLNSEGISAMVRLVTDANTRGCHVIYAAPNAFVSEVLAVTRLDSFFDITPSVDEAVRIMQSRRTDSGGGENLAS